MKGSKFVIEPLPPDVADLIEMERQRSNPPQDVNERIFHRVASTVGLSMGGPGGPGDGDGSSSVGSNGTGGQAGSFSTGAIAEGLTDSSGAATAETATSASTGLAQVVSAVFKLGTAIPFAVGIAVGVGAHSLISYDNTSNLDGVKIDFRPVVDKPAEPDLLPEDPPAPTPELPDSEIGENGVAETVEQQGPPVEGLLQKPEVKREKDSAQPKTGKRQKRTDDLAAERNLIEIARTALGRGRGANALSALNQHKKTFPMGRLTEEREALIVLALAALGRLEEAQKRAQRFRRAYPKSMFLHAVNQVFEKTE